MQDNASDTIDIGGRILGAGQPCFIIAEAGVNHNGDLATAERLVDAAARAGADAVKFQTFRTELLVTGDAPQAEYQAANTGARTTQFEMLKRLELGRAEHRILQERCRQRGVMFLSTPFEEESADFLEELGVPAFKLPSGELTNLPFLAHVAAKQRPIILSTGMASMAEVEQAVRAIRKSGRGGLVLLHCVSAYPAPARHANLRAMHALRDAFRVPVGFSDHMEGGLVACAAVALGACVVEKHFTLDKAMPGPDHRASLEPEELAALVRSIREVESALGDGVKRPAEPEREVAAVARKSICAAQPIPAGSTLSAGMLALRRPGTGLPAKELESLLGRRTRVALAEGELLRWDMVEAAS